MRLWIKGRKRDIISATIGGSQNQLHSAEDELDRMKQYLNEVLEEVASFKKTAER